MKHILVLAPSLPTHDYRLVLKIVQPLLNSGWSVDLLAQRGDRPLPRSIRLQEVPRRHRWRRFLYAADIFQLLRTAHRSIVLTSGFESWIIACLYKPIGKYHVVFDAREDYVDVCRRWFKNQLTKSAFSYFTRTVIAVLSRATDLAVISRKSLERQFACPSVVFYNPFPPGHRMCPPTARDLSRPLVVGHAGLLNLERGAAVLRDACAELRRRNIPVEVRILGPSYQMSAAEACDAIPELLELAESSRAGSVSVRIEGWTTFDNLLDRLAGCHVGLVLFQPWGDNLSNPMPNKLFDYMASGMATISPSWAPELGDIVRQSSSGLLVDTANPLAVADSLQYMYENESARLDFARGGSAAVIDQFGHERLFGLVEHALNRLQVGK